jgi:hypothetical protein
MLKAGALLALGLLADRNWAAVLAAPARRILGQAPVKTYHKF